MIAHNFQPHYPAEVEDEEIDEKFFHQSGMTAYPRRHTEPDTSYNTINNNDRPQHTRPHRSATYGQWNEQHVHRARYEPLVEYVCEKGPIQQEDEDEALSLSPSTRHDRLVDLEDEEAPMTIPSSYQDNESERPRSNRRSNFKHHDVDEVSHPNNLNGSWTSNKFSIGHVCHDGDEEEEDDDDDDDSEDGCEPLQRQTSIGDDLMEIVARYVSRRSMMYQSTIQNSISQQQQQQQQQPQLLQQQKKKNAVVVGRLARKVLEAVKTGQWECLPEDLARDVQAVLV